jgi:hypothetical protein
VAKLLLRSVVVVVAAAVVAADYFQLQRLMYQQRMSTAEP